MFTAAEIQLIRAHCPSDFESLLRELSVSVDWSGDEYRIAEKVDDDITKKISALMKSSSIIAGYKSLLKIGGIVYDYGETDNELLAKVVANSEKILEVIRESHNELNAWQNNFGNISPEPERVETLSMEVSDAKPFDNGYLLTKVKSGKNFSKDDKVRTILNGCVGIVESLNNLFSAGVTSQKFSDVDDFVKTIIEPLRAGDSITLRLKISKNIESLPKKIPPKPDAPKFDVHEAEKILGILERVNEIVKQI